MLQRDGAWVALFACCERCWCVPEEISGGRRSCSSAVNFTPFMKAFHAILAVGMLEPSARAGACGQRCARRASVAVSRGWHREPVHVLAEYEVARRQ